MLNFSWNDLESSSFPWIKSFSKIIKSAAPPHITGDTILISSDYSGDFKKNKYTVFSIIIIDLAKIKNWDTTAIDQVYLFTRKKANVF